ncbi:MAG: hypothetical protein WDN47_04230 [Candidatus Doudnabacteria bacterium]
MSKIASSLRSSQMPIMLGLVLFILFFSVCSRAHAAVLFSGAANQDVYEGQTFVVDWYLDSEGKSINSLDLKLNFSKDTLEVSNATAGNSLISLWIKDPTADNSNGNVELVGGITNGINSNKIPVFRTVFRAKTAGAGFINLDPSSVVLLNDGSGSNEPLRFKNETFDVLPKGFIPILITSTSHPDPDAWYKNRDVVIKFTPKTGEDYSYSFSSNIDIIPDDKKQDVPAQISYPNMPDGIYYFKLNSKVGDANWSEAAVFRVQIDATPPEPFSPAIASDPTIFGGNKFVSFSTVDKISGISYYKVQVGLFGRSIETQSPYKLSKPFVGDSVQVEAVDIAGNMRDASIAFPGFLSTKAFEWILVLIGLAAIALGFRKQITKFITKRNENNIST